MTPSLSASPAVRLVAALAASAALHAGAAYVAGVLPRGSPSGMGTHLASAPVQLRILGAEAAAAALPASPAADPRPQPSPPDQAAAPAAAPPTGVPHGLLEGPRYYPPSQLDVRPRLLTRVEPVYPQGAPPDGGHAVLRLLIGEDGRVERAVVVSSAPVDKFGEAAAAAFADAQFSSGELKGVAVKSQLLIEMTFRSLLPPGAASAAKPAE